MVVNKPSKKLLRNRTSGEHPPRIDTDMFDRFQIFRPTRQARCSGLRPRVRSLDDRMNCSTKLLLYTTYISTAARTVVATLK